MPTLDIEFRLTGREIPADHGYSLFAAITRLADELEDEEHLGQIHKAGMAPVGSPWQLFGIHPINGQPVSARTLVLTPASRLTFRLDSDLIKDLLPLVGNELDLAGHKLRVGVPDTYTLVPAASVQSGSVTVKHQVEPEPFLRAVEAELAAMGIQGSVGLLKYKSATPFEGHSVINEDRAEFVRRTLHVTNKDCPATVVGYAVMVQGLTAAESLTLQEQGIGGRRRFGCGIFVPVSE